VTMDDARGKCHA